MPGSDPMSARAALGGQLPRRTPGGTDLRVFANDLLRPGRHRRDRLLLLRPWSTLRHIGGLRPTRPTTADAPTVSGLPDAAATPTRGVAAC